MGPGQNTLLGETAPPTLQSVRFYSIHLGNQCYEITPVINVSNFTFVILVLFCHFDTSLHGTVWVVGCVGYIHHKDQLIDLAKWVSKKLQTSTNFQ